MAKPIPLQLPPRDPQNELRGRLEQAPAGHAAAILSTYELIQALHDCGALELLRGLAATHDKILEEVVDAAKKPESVRGIQNLLILVKMFGAIDPDLLQNFATAVPEALSAAKEETADPPGLLTIVNRLRHKDVRRGLVAINGLLEAWGKHLSLNKTGPEEQT
jgi:uncharacterized protein YjgD (DUF1641 family)